MSSSGGAVVVAMARRAERLVVQTLREHGATSADRAVPLSLGRPGGRAALKRLIRREAVRESGDRYWLDESAYETMRDGRRVRAVFALIVVAAIIIGFAAFGAFRAEAQTPGLRPDQAAFRDLYEELVETNTTLSEGSCTLAAERMGARLIAAGYPAADVRVLAPTERPKDGNLAAVLHGSDPSAPPLLLLAHIDVVEARRAEWDRDPFTLVEEDGYFYARGATDDKAQAAVWVDAMVRLRTEGFTPRQDIKIALTCGEETADTWNGVEWLLREHPDVLQAGFALNEGAGGQLDAEGNRIALNVQAGEKLYQDYTLVLTNPGGHSSRPRKDNAIAAMSRSLAALGDYDFALELNPVTRAYFAAMANTSPQYAADLRALTATDTPDPAAAARLSAAYPVWNATMRTTCIPTLIDGGHAPNAQPQTVTANVNCRILPGHTIEETQAEIARVLNNAEISITPLGAPDPTSPPPVLSPAIIDPIREVAGRMWPGVPVVPTMTPGATDGRFTNKAGIPTYGVTGMFADPDGGGAHGLNERIRVRSLYEGRDFLFDLVKAYAAQP